MVQKRIFSPEFKAEAVRLVNERGIAATQAAKDLDVHYNVLRKWIRKAAPVVKQSVTSVGGAEQTELVRLRRENAQLKAERDLLKKAAVGSTGQRNMIDVMMHWGIHNGANGTTGTIG